MTLGLTNERSTHWWVVIVTSTLLVGCPTDPVPTPDTTADTEIRDADASDAPDTADATDTTPDTADASSDADARDGGDTCRECARCIPCKYRAAPEVSCQSEEPPDRCPADPTRYRDWGPAAVLTSLDFTSDEAKDCCDNIDGSDNGSPDNKLGELLASFPVDVERQIQTGFLQEDFAGIAEFDGLESLDQEEPFRVNIALGRFGSADARHYLAKSDPSCEPLREDCQLEADPDQPFLVSPETLDDGVHAQAHFPQATIRDGHLRAGPAHISLNVAFERWGTFAIDIRGATLEADVDLEATQLEGDDTGVVLRNGEVGGYVRMKDAIDVLNDLLQQCDCLGNPERTVRYPNRDDADPDLVSEACARGNRTGETCELSCADAVDTTEGTCETGISALCTRADALCNVLSLFENLPDLDVDGDGQTDAVSAGALFETERAKLRGVADYLRGPDQVVIPNGDVRLDEVFANQPGWVALYDDASLRPERHVGHRRIEPGHHRDVAVELDTVLERRRPLWAVLHRDDGDVDGEFEPARDSKVERYRNMYGSVRHSFVVTPAPD